MFSRCAAPRKLKRVVRFVKPQKSYQSECGRSKVAPSGSELLSSSKLTEAASVPVAERILKDEVPECKCVQVFAVLPSLSLHHMSEAGMNTDSLEDCQVIKSGYSLADSLAAYAELMFIRSWLAASLAAGKGVLDH
ncbi:hypothetical protein E2C01_026562 [Portunus trituberculatus]|uniref:Uncharacterized protein n=1 Tax=Portunus trituberculatus TaxID=210409 RepID=A0A5B7EJ76_PORTR|nr:hypothetical protein [Portunus trituberculatus]